MNNDVRSHLPEHCTQEFLDEMRRTASTSEELPDVLVAAGFAPELALENPNLPLSALQDPTGITNPNLEGVGGLAEMATAPSAPEWLLELALQSPHPRVRTAALANPNAPLDSRLRCFRARFDNPKLFPHEKIEYAATL